MKYRGQARHSSCIQIDYVLVKTRNEHLPLLGHFEHIQLTNDDLLPLHEHLHSTDHDMREQARLSNDLFTYFTQIRSAHCCETRF